jgi:glycosyltransferase involved in cell wall biosynthesis
MKPLRVLEVGALPFPTHQGTQALLREQCEALARRGNEVHLLVYAHCAYPYTPPGYSLHRLADWPRERSLRSGPSWRKAVLDIVLAAEVRRLSERLRPDVVHAHNYEGLVAALAARQLAPVVYHAHTLFEYELPTFAPPAARLAVRAIGGAMDRALPRRAALTLAVSPRLAMELVRRGHPPDLVEPSLPGFDVPPQRPGDGDRVRRRLGLHGCEVVGYAGNLDSYQGLPWLVDAVAELAMSRPALRLLVITASDTRVLEQGMAARGVADRLRLVPHGSFTEAFEHIGAAHVCAVPRTAPGGIPIKLLAYLAAGRPVVSTESGTAGLMLGDAVTVVADRDPVDLARGVAWLLDHPAEADRRGAAGRAIIERGFSWDRRGEVLENQLRRAAATKQKRSRSR